MVKKKSYYKRYGNLFSGESNPFNIKVNRKKHTVLDSDVKGTKGLPVISKGINYAKRKEFLKKNKVASQKSNTYIDKRNRNVSFEDNVTARFVREHQKKSKKNVFNLNGEEDFKGKEPAFNDNHFDEEKDLLDANKGQFGETLLSDNPKTRKEIMEDIIADSKQKKMERKMEKEKYLNNLEQVDNAWRELHSMGSKTNLSKNLNKIIAEESNAKDPYDSLKFELKFEQKCSSISHTKSTDELTKEEEQKRIQLEKEKLKRMNDNKDLNSAKTFSHVSADAIGDEYEYLQPIEIVEDKYEAPESSSESDAESDDSHSSSEEMDQDENDSETETISLKEDYEFLPEIPDNINDFRARVKDCNAEQLDVVLENILKKFSKSKNIKILNKLEKFFEVLLEYVFELCEKKFPKFELISAFPSHLYSLTNAVNLGTANIFLKFLDKEHQVFSELTNRRMKRNSPRLQTIVILKYAALIYSTSDFRHPVVTPAMIFMCEILGSVFCITFINILSRLLVSELILNCIADSKRFVPEAVNFLNNILKLAVPVKHERKSNLSNPKLFDLIITNKVSDEDIPTLDLFQSNGDLTDESKKISIVFTITNQLLQYITLYNELHSFQEIFAPILNICSQLPIDFYPVILQNQIKKLTELGQKNVSLHCLSFQKAKPKPLKMFEPAFESKFNQKDDINEKRKKIKKVAQKIKKEEKSMLREIRRDAQVAASEKLKGKLELDEERKRKVKEIYGNLAVQEGEFKKMMKKKT